MIGIRPRMRQSILFLVLAFFALPAFAQRAPNIPRGTNQDETLRIFGWPKGKSVTGHRESWLYDKFQVTFENRKVISVAYVSAGTASAVRSSQTVPLGVVSGPTQTANVQGPGASPNPVRTGSPALPAGAPAVTTSNSKGGPNTTYQSPTRVIRKYEQVRIVQAPTGRPLILDPDAVSHFHRPIAEPSSVLSRRWPLPTAAFVGLMVVAATVLLMRMKARSLGVTLLERTSADAATEPSKNWQDRVGDQLRSMHGTQSVPRVDRPDETTRAEGSAAGRNRVLRGGLFSALTVELLRELEWKRFELIVQRYYCATGVRAELTCAGADGGIDVKLFHGLKDQAFCYVQCKAWGTEKVKLREVREFLGVMAADKIEYGIFVVTSDFWPDARTFANANGIDPLTAEDFTTVFNALPEADRARILDEVTEGNYTTPSCPACEVKAVSRYRKRDGVKFWSCRCGWSMTARAESNAR